MWLSGYVQDMAAPKSLERNMQHRPEVAAGCATWSMSILVGACVGIYSGQIITTSLISLTGIMVSKGNNPQMALIQVSEIL